MNALKRLVRTPRRGTALGLALALARRSCHVRGDPVRRSRRSRRAPARQITNIDVLRQQIRNYYGDPLGTGASHPTATTPRRRARRRVGGGRSSAEANRHHRAEHPAIVLDVDDTTLATWNYEIFSNWAYNPTTNATYVTDQLFPAVPGMVDMVEQGRRARATRSST